HDPDRELGDVAQRRVVRVGLGRPRDALRLDEDRPRAHKPIPTAAPRSPTAAAAAPATAPSTGSGAACSIFWYASFTLSSSCASSVLRLSSLLTSVSSVGLRSNPVRSGGMVLSNAGWRT